MFYASNLEDFWRFQWGGNVSKYLSPLTRSCRHFFVGHAILRPIVANTVPQFCWSKIYPTVCVFRKQKNTVSRSRLYIIYFYPEVVELHFLRNSRGYPMTWSYLILATLAMWRLRQSVREAAEWIMMASWRWLKSLSCLIFSQIKKLRNSSISPTFPIAKQTCMFSYVSIFFLFMAFPMCPKRIHDIHGHVPPVAGAIFWLPPAQRCTKSASVTRSRAPWQPPAPASPQRGFVVALLEIYKYICVYIYILVYIYICMHITVCI